MTIEEEFELRKSRPASVGGGSPKRVRIGDRVFASGRLAAAFFAVPPSVIARARKQGHWRGLRVEEVD